MKYRFTKMQGCANDYIYINCFEEHVENPEKLSIEMSRRHFSIGADGLVLICPSNVADAKMRMFNNDGSEGKMCGNAIRCVGKFLYDNKIVNKELIKIETLSGIKTLSLQINDGKVNYLSVKMGKAVFSTKEIPCSFEKEEMINEPIFILNKEERVTAVSMGNPHEVIYVDDVESLDLERIGKYYENNPYFPERVNTEFIQVIDNKHLKMRVWERGSGETYACGTGACASVAASIKNGICNFNEDVKVELKGGTLLINIDKDYEVTMKGPAKKVCEGVYDDED